MKTKPLTVGKLEPELRTLSIATIDLTGNIRKLEKDDSLRDLAGSIKTLGILEPPIVMLTDFPKGKAKKPYQMVAGYRRVAAAKLAGLTEIPVLIRQFDEATRREAQLVENLQRNDLDPMDEARAMQDYLELKKCTPKELGARIGKSHDYVTGRVNLLRLPKQAVDAINSGKWTPRHGAAVMKIPDAFKGHREQFVKDLLEDSFYIASAEEVAGDAARYAKRLKGEEATAKVEAKKVEKMKHKTCPVVKCGKPAKGVVWGTDSTLYHDADKGSIHKWSGKTGKITTAKRDTYGGHGSGMKRSKPKPIDRKEPRTVRVGADLPAILQAMIKSGGASIDHATVHTFRGSRGTELQVRFKKGTPFAGDVDFRSLPYTTGQKTQALAGGFDSKQRRSNKATWSAWAKKNLRKPTAPKKSAVKVEGKAVLAGTVSDVAKRIAKVKDLEVLEELRAVEAKGKARGGVFDLIDHELSVEPNAFMMGA